MEENERKIKFVMANGFRVGDFNIVKYTFKTVSGNLNTQSNSPLGFEYGVSEQICNTPASD